MGYRLHGTMGLYRCNGVVLRTHKLGESDRIITFVTDTRGKVRAVAKGVRKTKSRIGARLEPTTHVSLLLYEGRELDVVNQAEAVEHFKNVRDDIDRLGRAAALLEAVDAVSQECHDDPSLYRMLVGALGALDRADSPTLVPAFYWKLLTHEGYEPILDSCVRCQTELIDLRMAAGFDAAAGGVTCRTCTMGQGVGPEAMALLERVLNGGLSGVLREPAGVATRELERMATVALEHVLDRRLRAGRLVTTH